MKKEDNKLEQGFGKPKADVRRSFDRARKAPEPTKSREEANQELADKIAEAWSKSDE